MTILPLEKISRKKVLKREIKKIDFLVPSFGYEKMLQHIWLIFFCTDTVCNEQYTVSLILNVDHESPFFQKCVFYAYQG